jgi:hypothetical protein
MLVTIPNADNFQVQRGLFVAAWKVWFKRFHDNHLDWPEGRMPISRSDKPLHQLLDDGQRFSLELTCRLIVPWNYRNKEMASETFIQMNPALFRPVPYTMPNGDVVDGVRLTDQALDLWDELSYIAQDLYMSFAEARIQADIETDTSEAVVIDDAGIVVIGNDIYPPLVPEHDDTVDEYVQALVAWIAEDPFQPLYQRKPVGEAISGWDQRLKAMFWPKPRMGYNELSHISSPLLYRAGLIGKGVDNGVQWSYEDKQLAIKTANEIFMLYGVPQREVTAENIEAVIRAAIKEDSNSNAKMNSGWTQIAAYATHFLEENSQRTPHVAWNSRIATSIISRLDFLLVEAGCDSPDKLFPHIGTVPGWGGTRPREFSLNWPTGYRQWSTQIAASKLITSMRDILNNCTDKDGNHVYPRMPLAGGDRGLWTVRGVQMVLSQDGY